MNANGNANANANGVVAQRSNLLQFMVTSPFSNFCFPLGSYCISSKDSAAKTSKFLLDHLQLLAFHDFCVDGTMCDNSSTNQKIFTWFG